MKKNNFTRHVLTLVIFCLAASGFLGVFRNFAQTKTGPREMIGEEKNFKEVFPAAVNFERVDEGPDTVYFKAFDADKNMLGVVFTASRHGYASDIVTMAGMDKEGKIVRIKVLSQDETPGLGARVAEPLFRKQFNGKPVDSLGASIDAITGATITSRAVIDALQEKGMAILKKVKNG